MGNDLATLPDFPAEIRAPAGSLPGVSGFQVHFADHDIFTPGDQPNVLVAMNPAALKTNLKDLPKGGMLIVNTDAFNERNLQKAGYATSPLADGSLEGFHVHEVALTSMTVEALKGVDGITSREAERSKNFFALGLMLLALPPADRGDARVHRAEVRQAARDRRGEHQGLQGGLQLRRDIRGLRRLVRDRARASSRPAATGRSPGNTAIELRAASPPRSSPACRSSSAPTRSRRPRRSSRSWRGTRTSASRRSRRRTRSPPAAPRSARRSAARSASRPRPGPGIVLKAEMVGLGRDARAAAPRSSTSSAPAPRPGCRRSRSRPTC